MKGGIYSDEKCPVCGEKLRDNHKDGLTCPKHPQVYSRKFSVRFKRTHLRFNSYIEADQELSALRHNIREYDPRDYQKKKPLAFSNLAGEYLKTKEGLASYGHIARNLQRAIDFFGESTHIKEIQDGELEDLAHFLDVASKTKHNIMTDVKACFKWVWRRNRKTFNMNDFPEFPVIQFEMETRRHVSKEIQWSIMEQVERMFPIRTYLAIRWLIAYPKIRPGDIATITEGDINRETGMVRIPHPKERRVKYIYLIEEDIELVNTLPLAMPSMPFFRHEKSGHGVKIGQSFGKNYLHRRWDEACCALGVEGISLYPGTKHSSITGLNTMGYSPEDIQTNATGHLSTAFRRYLISDIEKQRELSRASLGKNLVKKNSPYKAANLLNHKGLFGSGGRI